MPLNNVTQEIYIDPHSNFRNKSFQVMFDKNNSSKNNKNLKLPKIHYKLLYKKFSSGKSSKTYFITIESHK